MNEKQTNSGFQRSLKPVILFTDFTGWTAFLEQIEQLGHNSYQKLAYILAEFFKKSHDYSTVYGSMIANRTGDGFLSLVENGSLEERVSRAFIIANEIHDIFISQFHPSLEQTFPDLSNFIPSKIRMALHSSKVFRMKQKSKLLKNEDAIYDYLSHGINVTARILGCKIAEDYDIACSEIVTTIAINEGFISDSQKVKFENLTMKNLLNPIKVVGINLDYFDQKKIWGIK